MSDNEIVRMANDIANFFVAYPHEEAVAEIAQHIRDFWDPRMRRAMSEHLAAGGEGLEPLARAGAEAALRPA
ncbi:MAG: formate dehydrogenase subunit delta [Amaricoccus sp.]|uniref:formate dehydrogenase subunit delta n=1 Tax=Amaricoccus sp. TaxID=1872485 RepID=UPI0039E59FF2